MKNNPIIKILFVFLVTSIQIFSCKEFEDDLEVTGKAIPSFTLLFPDSTFKLGTADLPSNKPTVLFCLSTECPYCRKQVEDIINNMNTLDNINFLLFTPDSFVAMKNYVRQFNLQLFRNIKMGADTGSSITNKFQISSVPYLLFYDSNNQFIYAHLGIMSVDSIKHIVNKDIIAR